jgi:ribonuclease E
MVKKETSESSAKEPIVKKPAAKKPAARKADAKATEKKPAAKSTKKSASAEATEQPVADKGLASKPKVAGKTPAKTAGKKKASADDSAKPKAKAKTPKTEVKVDAPPVAVTATSMIFMAPDLPTPVIDKKRGRPVEDKKSSDQPESNVRRRSRRREGEIAEGEQLPPNTVVKVRTPREPKEFSNEPTRVKGSTRLEAKKQRRRDGRDAGRRRTTITESEFLARREAVERTMIVRSKDEKIQLGVLEDKVLVEHYVAKASEPSLIGNVYLGKVQNVLPSMEAAFVDIGRGRNAVLYSGEVDW